METNGSTAVPKGSPREQLLPLFAEIQAAIQAQGEQSIAEQRRWGNRLHEDSGHVLDGMMRLTDLVRQQRPWWHYTLAGILVGVGVTVSVQLVAFNAASAAHREAAQAFQMLHETIKTQGKGK